MHQHHQTLERTRPCARTRAGLLSVRRARAGHRGLARLLVLLLCLSPAAAGAQQAEALRAAFVLNFLMFAEWPAAAMGDASAPLVVAVIGEDLQSGALEAGLDGKEIQGRKLVVRVYGDAAKWRLDGAACQALYLTPAAHEAWAGLRAELAGRPVLTICETPGFCAQGGMLNLYQEDQRIRFEANPAAADKARLKLRSTLLTLATIVKTEGGLQ